MDDPAIAKVEDAFKALLQAWPALWGWTIVTDQSSDVALEEGSDKQVLIYTTTYSVDQSDEQHQTIHDATIEFEVVSQSPATGTISRTNHAAIANIIGALASDRTLGGRLLDVQEIDVAPASPNGRDVGNASLQCRVQFFTSRSDWFTILGQGGATF